MALSRRTLLALAAAMLPLRAEAVRPLRVLGDHHYPPFSALVDGRAVGLLVDGLRRAETRLAQPFALELTGWRRALREAETQGQVGLIGVSFTRDRARWLDYSAPVETDVVHLVSLRARPQEAESLAALRGLRIGVGNGISYGQEFEDALAAGLFQVDRDWGPVQRLRMLLAGRLDAVLIAGGPVGVEAAIATDAALRAQRDALLVAPRPLIHDPLHLAFPKRMRQQALLERVAAAWAAA